MKTCMLLAGVKVTQVKAIRVGLGLQITPLMQWTGSNTSHLSWQTVWWRPPVGSGDHPWVLAPHYSHKRKGFNYFWQHWSSLKIFTSFAPYLNLVNSHYEFFLGSKSSQLEWWLSHTGRPGAARPSTPTATRPVIRRWTCWRPACCWLGWGPMSIGDPSKSH